MKVHVLYRCYFESNQHNRFHTKIALVHQEYPFYDHWKSEFLIRPRYLSFEILKFRVLSKKRSTIHKIFERMSLKKARARKLSKDAEYYDQIFYNTFQYQLNDATITDFSLKEENDSGYEFRF
ncbi:hypothetical protein BpHYR1_002580 [Brachionus plicatilis]|uniref:Uncharacterized protein n=1 Tax=Brachionus plicatilis TaxID=10195 RepID=A0A3M7PCI6_BRAPC|nr:hypothetical protein BpHYR1_002580 [Brachionus plicatilis]